MLLMMVNITDAHLSKVISVLAFYCTRKKNLNIDSNVAVELEIVTHLLFW